MIRFNRFILIWPMLFLSMEAFAQVIEIPIWRDLDGRVRVHILFDDDGAYDFIIDTGAMHSFITPALVKARNLKQLPAEDAKQSDLLMGFTPYVSQDVMVGGTVLFKLDRPGAVQNLSISEDTVHGVLGEDFLSRYAVEFDSEREIMRLAKSVDDLRADRTFTSTDLHQLFPGKGLLSLQIEVAGLSIRSFLDTGAAKTMINSVLYEMIKDEQLARIGELQSIQSSHGHAQNALNVVLNSISLEGRTWEEAEVLVSDGIFSQLRMMDGPALLLGANLLFDDRAFIIDYSNNSLWLEVTDL